MRQRAAELSAAGRRAAFGKFLKSFGVFGAGIPHYQMKRAFGVWRRIERRCSGTSFKRPKPKKTMKRHFTSTLAAAVLGLLASSGFAAAQAYTITDLGADTMPYAVNDGGQVAGAVNYSINNFAEVAGYALWADGHPNALYWTDANGNGVSDSGEMASLGTLGAMSSVANTINDAGQVAGWATHDAQTGAPVDSTGSKSTGTLLLASRRESDLKHHYQTSANLLPNQTTSCL
jgi:hypothetical protein